MKFSIKITTDLQSEPILEGVIDTYDESRAKTIASDILETIANRHEFRKYCPDERTFSWDRKADDPKTLTRVIKIHDRKHFEHYFSLELAPL